MGQGDAAPYLYDPPSRRQIAYPYSDFDPKAATRASWISAAESTVSRPKQEGPLVDFNRHPDSYMVVTPQTPRVPLPPNTKTKVVATRWVQFGFRIAQLVGAVGCLLCVIFVRNTEEAQGWIMRIPPAWDMCVTTYAVYHLACPAKRRTPASSASYHIFSMMMDSGLIPFYVYTSWFAHQNWIAMPDNETRWKNIFNDDPASTDPLLLATFLVPTIVGGLHLICLGIGLYLTILFRKIAQMPNDMNPLEDNLTSRKHQYKNSDASAMSMMQKPGYMSGSTLSVDDRRFSKAMPEDRTIDFRHSRVGSEMDFSPHNPRTARLSRQVTEERNLCHSLVSGQNARQSFVQTSRPGSVNPGKRDMDSFSFVGDLASAPAPPPHASQDRSHSPRPGSSVSVRDHAFEQAQYAQTHDHLQSQQKESLLSDNWFVNEESERTRDGDLGAPALPPNSPSQRRTPNFSRPSPVGSPDPERAARFSPMLSPLPSNHQAQFMPMPLRMNPPTPPNDDIPLLHNNNNLALHHDPRHDSFQEPLHATKYPHELSYNIEEEDDDDTSTIAPNNAHDNSHNNDPQVNRSHTTASAQSTQSHLASSSVYSESSHFAASSVYSESAPSLRTANHLHQQSTPNFTDNSLHVHSVGTPKFKQYGDLAAATRGIRNHQVEAQMAPPPQPPKHGGAYGGGGRVVSRSGADISDEALFVSENGGGRRRYVSGKAAEEGMAGGRW